MCFRYANEVTYGIHKRLLAVKESLVTTGKKLYSIFITVMNAETFELKKRIIGQSYDETNNIRDYYLGFQAHIKKERMLSSIIYMVSFPPFSFDCKTSSIK